MRPIGGMVAVGRVVVIGASAAGLFAAAAAATAGMTVTILEQDDLRDDGRPRPGVPQSNQPHILLHRGLLAAQALLPGFREDLLDAGAVVFDTADVAWLGEQGWNPGTVTSYPAYSITQPLLELLLRRRVATLPQVHLLDGSGVVGLGRELANGQRGPWTVTLQNGSRTDADLVIDASGRNSRLSAWLGDTRCRDVPTTEIDAKVGYTSRLYRGDPGLCPVPGVVLQPTHDDPRGGLALPVENGRWMILAIGLGDHRPPEDAEGFQAFLTGLRDPALAQLARRLEPVGDLMVHRQTGNRRRHYEDQKDWPDGLLVMGDALCAFNPMYGQGISIAACEAVLLRDALRRGLTYGGPLQGGLEPGETRNLLRQFAKAVALPWTISTGTDLHFDSCEQSPSRRGRLSNSWTTELARLAVHGNDRAASTLGGVYHLMTPPRRLMHPSLIRASIVSHLRGYGPAAPRPTGLAALAYPRSAAP